LTANEQLSAFRAQLLGAAEPSTAPIQLPPQTVPPPGMEFKQPLTINTDGTTETGDQIVAGNTDGSASPTSGGEDGDGSKRGNKRELSTSKRAAQNRAAQRAFRQRKENYIKVCGLPSDVITSILMLTNFPRISRVKLETIRLWKKLLNKSKQRTIHSEITSSTFSLD